jgi:hypothetical protein
VKCDAGTPLNYFTGLLLEEYAGIASTFPVDVSTVEVGSVPTLSITAGTLKTTAACDVVTAAFTDGDVTGETIQPGTGWTFRSTDFWDPGGCLDDGPGWAPPNSAFGTPIAVETVGPSNTWVATQMAFRSAAAPALAQPSDLTFSTPAQTLDAGTCSTAVGVSSVGGGVATRTGAGFWVDLDGGAASFFADPACQFPVGQVYLGAGTSSQTFYFEGKSSGSLTLSASAAGFSAISQVEEIR